MARTDKIVALGLSLFIACLLVSCKSDTVGPSGDTFITGIVRDTAGVPVPNAYLNFIFYLRNTRTGEISGDVPPDPDSMSYTVTVGFDVPRRGLVSVVMRNYLREYIRTVVRDSLDEGAYGVEFPFKDMNGRTLYSDLFLFEIALDDSLLQTRKVLLDQSLHLASNPALYAQTDKYGRFMIPTMRLPFKEILQQFTGTTNDTLVFDDHQTLYAFTATRYGRVKMSISNPADLSITLDRPKR
jgi:hypothetical protein